MLLVCDHASRRIPRALGELGLDQAARDTHLAWDIGAGELTRRLAKRLDAPAVLHTYSRLVVDCNRSLDDPTAFLCEGDGRRIPGNENLGEAARRARVEACYWPYHEAVAAEIGRLSSGERVPALIAIHSFTPVLDGAGRDWDVGVLWDKDPRIPLPLIEAFRRETSLTVGDNEPYSGRSPADFTIDHHAEPAGLPHTGLEIRQDHLIEEAGIERWAERLARAFGPILDNEALYRRLAAVADRVQPGRAPAEPERGFTG